MPEEPATPAAGFTGSLSANLAMRTTETPVNH